MSEKHRELLKSLVNGQYLFALLTLSIEFFKPLILIALSLSEPRPFDLPTLGISLAYPMP